MRKMKDSGIEWIGEIPESWTVDKVKYCSNLDSCKLSEHTDPEYEFKYIDISSVTEYGGIGETTEMTFDKSPSRARMVVNNGDIIISTVRTYLKAIAYIDSLNDHICSTGFCVVTPNKKLHPKFGYYLLQSDYFVQRIVSQSVGVSYPAISSAEIGNMPIVIPSIREQSRIADYLDQKCAEIDAIIAAKEKTNELLKERRQSIIYEAVTKGLDPTVPMKDSGVEWIGEIPMDWDVCPVKYLIDKSHPYPVGDGDHGMIKADDYLDEGIPYIRVLNLTWGEGLNLENLVYISEEMNSRIKNSELKPNDILIAKTGATIGKTAIVPDSLPRSNTTSHVGKITISSDHDSVFFYYVMTSSIVQKQIQDLSAMQSTRPELGIDGLRNLLVVVPPIGKQRDISEFLNQQCTEINAVIDTNSSMIDKLKEYRQSVIYEAVTGKIEV